MALATIVAVRGSTYRRPGARLLVPEDGAPVGNISGGCLEGDVADMARIVMEDGRARLAGWDLTADDDDVWGLGLGCNGAIEVFIEPADRAAEVAGALRMALEEERPISVVTVLESALDAVPSGARIVVKPDGSSEGSLGDAAVDAAAVAAASELLATQASEIRTLPGDIRAFVEVLEPPLRLLICGAGHDAIPLVKAASILGWSPIVVDDRRDSSRASAIRMPPGSSRSNAPEDAAKIGRGRRANVRHRDDAQLPSRQGVPAVVPRFERGLRRHARAGRADPATADGARRGGCDDHATRTARGSTVPPGWTWAVRDRRRSPARSSRRSWRCAAAATAGSSRRGPGRSTTGPGPAPKRDRAGRRRLGRSSPRGPVAQTWTCDDD